MSAKEQATQDIQESLKKEGKSFIHFIHSLDPIMETIEEEWIEEQEKKSWCVNSFSKPL